MKINKTMRIDISAEELKKLVIEHLESVNIEVKADDVVFEIGERIRGPQYDPYTETYLKGCSILCTID